MRRLPSDPDAPARARRSGGFTLIELLVVVAIIAMIGQMVLVNLGALIPDTVFNSESAKLMSTLEYLRSEAQLQGKVYKLELDLDRDAYRILMPPEERLVSEQTLEESVPLGWQTLDDRISINGHAIVDGPVQRKQRAMVVFDENGFTADQAIILRGKQEGLAEMVWTIQLRGLDRRSKLVTNNEGVEALLERTEEHQFN